MNKILKFLKSRLFIFTVILVLQVLFYVVLFMNIVDLHPAIRVIIVAGSIVLAMYLMYKNQDPTYKVIWIALICISPLFGILMYFFFSQRKIGRKLRRKLKKAEEKALDELEQDKETYWKVEQSDKGVARISDYIRETCYFPAYGDTDTEYFGTGEDFFERLVLELKKARRYIFMEYFIFKRGYMLDTILDILKEKAANGVDIRIMYDDMGCMFELPLRFVKKLEKYGIKCAIFNRVKPALNSLFNNRDHRKIVVIDGHTAFVGGANIADEYINVIKPFGRWKDACLMMKGKAAWGFLMMFIQMWDGHQRESTDVKALRPTEGIAENTGQGGFVQPFDDSPLFETNVCERVYLSLINRANDYLYITTPYLILNDALTNAFIAAAISGVDVRIAVPHIPDKKGVFYVTRSSCRQLLESGVRIYEYTPGFLHSKICVCDDELAVVGSINMDYRSLFLQFECAALLYKTKTVADVKKDFLNICEVGEEMTLEKVKKWPWYVRFAEAVCGLFAPMF
ncbi:MAG TPA: cardiolipin synthase [Candidatus Alectryocaccobium stercorigallinarum]|nr:cardiolipin synthase [Candidatus Alectryocaccobium stercorigallinarum]